MTIITLLTDYGIRDSYVAEVKGVILGINPEATIIDISHDIGNYDITTGAFHLARSVPYFPENTVHIGVIDPTVGSKRKPVIIKTKKAWLVGPDNGLMAPAAERLGIEEVYEIIGHPDFPTKISMVFDGRDTFGPAGALLSRGEKPENIGTPLEDIIRLPSYTPTIEKNTISGEIIHVDGFGNCVTNITYETLEKTNIKMDDKLKIKTLERTMNLPYVDRFSKVPVGEPLLLVAGGGYLELSINQGNAAEKMELKKGTQIKMEK